MNFKQVQQSFIDYIRDPAKPLPTGTSIERMQVYRELFFSNVMGFVSNGFPVLKSLYTQNDWLILVQDFFSQHDCQSPLFIDIAGEFLDFLQQEYQLKNTDPVFMLELAHYEWLELVVAVAQQDAKEVELKPENIQDLPLCLSSTARVAQYHYPVQLIRDDFCPTACLDTPVFFCIYQDEDSEVRFLQLNPLSAQVLAYLAEQGLMSFDGIVNWLTITYPQITPEALAQGCLQLLEQLAIKGIVRTHQS
ncbi:MULTISPECIES: DNA-binding domain-containing protein [unclassified Shewanella]|uniref:HvfC family RiPP maturation protein n=2 Tax=Shewanella TaxID=22 RepID=UPI002004EC7D|nr:MULTISPECIES: putative DNA-binding domain-containing protein [unclassified Shewanella]MCK7633357.1 putative DNA-binding domain-containing protein [Shewanella sp. JNE17]MCK7648582.1 putative DNA-binding domain-containing protein [Shewanella sp. JNE8]MCK7656663.1 putative DNA-binding domain-containing protein [Shewanella sp. JNE4-2]UPO29694.1 putative DNA-binding domain-containing protein [Shewanella sp. JNE2]